VIKSRHVITAGSRDVHNHAVDSEQDVGFTDDQEMRYVGANVKSVPGSRLDEMPIPCLAVPVALCAVFLNHAILSVGKT